MHTSSKGSSSGLFPQRSSGRRAATAAGVSRRRHRITAQAQSKGGSSSGTSSGTSPLELLRKENELLRQTLETAEDADDLHEDAEEPIYEQETSPHEGGVSVPILDKQQDIQETGISTPEDYWTPLESAAGNAEFQDDYGEIRPMPQHDGTECLKWDDSLWSHAEHFKYRWNVYRNLRQAIEENEGGLDKFSQGYKYFGLNRGEHDGKTGIWYREWAPGARALALVGEFNSWDPQPEHWAARNDFGVWQLFLPDKVDGTPAIPHRTKIKTRIETAYGEWVERIPAWIRWATQEWNEVQFNGVYFEPPQKGEPGQLPDQDTSYTFKYPRPPQPRALRIYECHVGMSSQEPKVNSYLEFRRYAAPHPQAGLQCYPDHGCSGACLLWLVWLPCHQLLCGQQQVWHA
jgi:1,4-alpha-glucan branching enzyme